MTGRHRLRLLEGGRSRPHRRGAVRIVTAPEQHPPFAVDAIAVEDDTYSVLGADPVMREPVEHPIRIWTALLGFVPAAPGTVRVGGGRPPRLLAVVHDLAQDPTWREEWVSRALAELLRYAELHGVQRLGLPPLGAVHGKLPAERFLALLIEALDRVKPARLEHLWLIARPRLQEELEHGLDALLGGPPERNGRKRRTDP